jgi:hypothetical protein
MVTQINTETTQRVRIKSRRHPGVYNVDDADGLAEPLIDAGEEGNTSAVASFSGQLRNWRMMLSSAL